MVELLRKFGLFYLAHAATFFLLCAYSLAADAPNYPFLPPLFFPIYLAAAVATSEREIGDPLLGILPIAPDEIMRAKFWLASAFIAVGWLNILLFTALQGLPADVGASVVKLGTLMATGTLLLFAAFQYGIHFFGPSSFRPVILGYTVVSAVFSIVFFVSLAERGDNHIRNFPLLPALEGMPGVVAALIAAVGIAATIVLLRNGPWRADRLAAE